MGMQGDIRPIYHELQGYVSKVTGSDNEYEAELWELANKAIEELNKISEGDYNRFKMIPLLDDFGQKYISKGTFRTKLSGLIERLHDKYFSSEPALSSGMPSTVISQTQVQTQTQTQMVLDLQSKIDE